MRMGSCPRRRARAAERHLAECTRCQALVAALREENRILGAAFGEQTALAPSPAGAVRPASIFGRLGAATNGRRAGAWGLALAALAGAAGVARLAGWGDLAARATGSASPWRACSSS